MSDQKIEVSVLDVPMYGLDIPAATSLIIDQCLKKDRNNYCISATGAHGLVFAKKNREFAQVLKSFFINLPDGMPGVWVGRIKGAGKMRRCYGPDFFKSVMIHTRDTPIKHFFCGGLEGVAVALKAAVRDKFGNDNVVGTFCPPFLPIDQYNYTEIAGTINKSNADIVWIGLSTPKQELFAFNLARETNVEFIVTVGAAFDFHTDRLRQAPAFLQKIGLEWFFRLVMEPKRLYKRYFEVVPLFIYYNFRELIRPASGNDSSTSFNK